MEECNDKHKYRRIIYKDENDISSLLSQKQFLLWQTASKSVLAHCSNILGEYSCIVRSCNDTLRLDSIHVLDTL